MYIIWSLMAVAVCAAALSLRKLYLRSGKRDLGPFQQSRPKPDLGTQRLSEEHSFESLESPLRSFSTSSSGVHISMDQVNPQSAREQREAVAHGVGTMPATGGQTAYEPADNREIGSVNRISTWSDRRLFQDFRGILNEGTVSLPLLSPEELPIRVDDFVFGSLTPSIAQLLPETDTRREFQRKMLVSAGYHSRAAWLNLSAVRFVLAFLSLVVVGFWLIVAPPAVEPWLLALLIMAPLFMWALPPLLVSVKASERKIDIERGLPDVLDMMNMGVSQGLTVAQSLRRISREIAIAHPALAEELRIVDQQAEVGSLPQALRNFGQRIDSPEVNSFTSLIVQSETTGTSISKALTDYSDSIRASLKERADARANAASFKLLFPVSLFLMPSVFLFLLGPAIVQMSDFFNNQAEELQQDRQEALQSLGQQPQLDLRQFGAPGGAFGGAAQ